MAAVIWQWMLPDGDRNSSLGATTDVATVVEVDDDGGALDGADVALGGGAVVTADVELDVNVLVGDVSATPVHAVSPINKPIPAPTNLNR